MCMCMRMCMCLRVCVCGISVGLDPGLDQDLDPGLVSDSSHFWCGCLAPNQK